MQAMNVSSGDQMQIKKPNQGLNQNHDYKKII